MNNIESCFAKSLQKKKKPTFLFVIPWALHHPGGVNQVVINLAKEMQIKGEFLPIVWMIDWDATKPVWGEYLGIKTLSWRLRSYSLTMGFKEKLLFHIWVQRFSKQFKKFCDIYCVTAINFHFPGEAAFTFDFVVKKIKNNVPFIMSFHGTDVGIIGSTSAHIICAWKELLHRSKVVVCSSNLGERLRQAVDKQLYFTVIHNGLDVNSFIKQTDGNNTRKERVILNVAKFEHQKGQDILIDAFSKIAEYDLEVILVLVGATAAKLPVLKEYVKKKSISHRVEFQTDIPHQKIANFFKDANIFCLPSRNESFGIVILEAASFGIPVVATNVGGIPEIITDNENGFLVQPDSVEELTARIKFLLDNPNQGKELGLKLQNKVKSEFSWHAAYQKYVRVIKEI